MRWCHSLRPSHIVIMKVFKAKRWACSCGYIQDFDPADPDLMALHFPGFPVGVCPGCVTRNREPEVMKETFELGTIRVLEESDHAALAKELSKEELDNIQFLKAEEIEKIAASPEVGEEIIKKS